MDRSGGQFWEGESVSYCINPRCRQRQNPAESETCFACETPLLINNRYRAVKMLYPQRENTEIFELQDFGVEEAGFEVPKILKVLKDDRDSDLVRLFQQEELILRRLKHLAVPQVFPGGYFTFETSCGRRLHCLVMEQIEGQNLNDWLVENGKITETQAIIWLKELTKILEAVHSKGWFHRDIKPSNIMCRPDGSLVLIDFGTATEIMSDTYINKYENRDVTVVCSPGYTPPEQMNGAAIPKSDLFALGRTFVHLMAGQHPNDLPKTAKAELSWRKFAPQILAPLADLIDGMMANDLQHRIQNPPTVLQRLAQIESLDLIIQNSKYRSAIKTLIVSRYIGWQLLKSRRVQLGVAASLLLGVLGFKLAAPPLAIYLNNCSSDSYNADNLEKSQLCANLALMLDSQLGESYYIQGLIFDANRNFQAARDRYEKSLKKVPDKSLNNLARLDILEKQYAAAIPRLEQGLQLVKEVDLKSALHKNMGWALLEKGDYQQAENHLNESIALDRTRASAYCLLAQVREVQKDRSGAFSAWLNCARYAPNEKNKPELENWVIQARQHLEVQGNRRSQ